MRVLYKLNYEGLAYLISTPESNPETTFLQTFLRRSKGAIVPASELNKGADGMMEVTMLINKMVEKGWISRIDGEDAEASQVVEDKLSASLQSLSPGALLMLVDVNGLALFDSGCEGIRKEFLSANAARYVLKSENKRNVSVESKSELPWGVRIKWGEKSVLARVIYIGTIKFILVVGESAQIDKQALILFVALLIRRYTSE